MKETESAPFVFTPENLLDNVHKLGPWSAYSLATVLLQHHFPDEYDEDGHCHINRELKLMQQLGCDSWIDAIKKYHKEVGYKPEHFNPESVNEF